MSRSLLQVVLSASVFALTLGPDVASAETAEAAQVVALINDERAARGLARLVSDPRLTAAAEDYAAEMAAANFFSHVGPNGSRMTGRNEAHGYLGWQFMGENLGAGQTTPARVVLEWMNSPPHRANILNPSLNDCGIAIATNPQSKYGYYFCVDFGARVGPAPVHPVNARNPGFYHP